MQDELLAEFLRGEGGGDMRAYARKMEADLRRLEKESINAYVRESVSASHGFASRHLGVMSSIAG